MYVLSQRDSRWNTKTIGDTELTVGRYGCLITSLCMLYTKFWKKPLYPNEVCKTWKFDSSGRLLWTQTHFDGMEFVLRGYDYNFSKIKEYANNPNKGVVVFLDGVHWNAVSSVIGPWIILHDPWLGKVLWNWKSIYKEISGYALFNKK